MTILWHFMALLALHWLADFVLQTNWQASNKSKRNDALAAHVCVYTLVLGAGSVLMFGWSMAWVCFVVANGILHFGTDYMTSRVSARFYAKQDWHNFFVVVGFDQLVHQTTLAATLALLFN